MRKRIILYGKLKKLYPDDIYVEANTVAEAIDAMCHVTGGAFNPLPGRGRHSVRVKGFDTEEAMITPTDVDELHIIPDFRCGKGGGVFQIIVGVVLVVVGVVVGVYSGFTNPWAVSLIMAGAGMILGGIVQMMSPTPKIDLPTFSQDNNPDASKYLGSPKNTVKVGTRIPYGYGRRMLYGHYLSFDIDAKEVAT